MTDLVQEQKERERRLREATMGFGEFQLMKTVWWNRIELDNALMRISIPRGGRLWDAGCSDGRVADRLRERRRADVVYVGTDFALNPLKMMLAKGGQALAVCADAARPLFRPGTFDAVVSLQVVQQLASREERLKMLKHIFSSLRPGGMFAVSVLNRPNWASLVANGIEGPLLSSPDLYVYLYTPEELRVDLEEVGFKVKEVVPTNNLPVQYLKLLGPLGVVLDLFITKYIRFLGARRGRYLLAISDRP